MVREFSAGGVVLRKMRGRWFLAVIEPHMTRPKKASKAARAVRAKRRRWWPCPRAPSTRARSRSRQRFARSAKKPVCRRTWSPSWPTSSTTTCATGAMTPASSRSSASICCCTALAGWETSHPRCGSKCRTPIWLPLEDAPENLSYAGEREVVAARLQYLKSHPELGDHATDTTH